MADTGSPCERCNSRRRCTRRCYAYKDWMRGQGKMAGSERKTTEVLRMATCKKCGASIIWLKPRGGKWMPADEGLIPYRQNPEGKDRLLNDYGETIRCDILTDGSIPTGMARRPHWATCPNADDFRKEKRGKRE